MITTDVQRENAVVYDVPKIALCILFAGIKFVIKGN